MKLLNLPFHAMLLISTALSVSAYAVPGSLTYQGRIRNIDGRPLDFNGVKFEFSIANPTGTCTIYRETSVAIDMRNSGGVFDVSIGTGSKAYPTSSTFKLLDSFDNSTAFTCENGGTYTPTENDKRLLRVQFFDGIGWRLIDPDSEIRAVPFAGHAKVAQTAQKLGSNIASDFVLKSNVPLCGAGQYLRHIAPLGTFECTSPTVTGNNVTGNITGSSAGFTGSLGGDVTGTQGATSVDKIKGVTLNMTGLAPGKVLKYNGTSWIPDNESGTVGALTGLTGDVTSTGSPTAIVTLSDGVVATNKIADGAITSSKIADGTIVDADISGSANITDTKLATITTAGKVSGSAITSGTIGGSTSINTSGSVTATGISSGTVSTNTLQIYKTGNGNKVSITVPASLSPDYSLQLPGTAGTSGQVLSTDGNGILSWISPSSGSVTSVTATAPLISTGGNAPVISLDDSGVVAGNYSKVTVNAKGLVTTGAALSASDIPNLSGDVISTSGTSNTKVEKIQGITVSSTTPQTGQVLIYGSNWAPQYFGMGQLRSTVTGNPQVPASCSTPDKTLTWSAITDSFACTSITIANTQVTGLGTASTKNFGTSAGNLVELDGTGKIPTSLLPSSTGNILDGGNSTGATLNIGTKDANSLNFITSSSTQMAITPTGNVGIGTSNPQELFEVGKSSGARVAFSDAGGASRKEILMMSPGTINGYGRIAAYDYGTSTGLNLVLQDSGGNVGIGTTTPGALLDVAGVIRADTLCDRNGANCKAINTGWTSTGAATSMVPNFPDAIRCAYDASGSSVFMYPYAYAATTIQYQANFGGGYYMLTFFTADGSYSHNANLYNGTSLNCVNKSISQLTASGQTWLYAGGGGNIWTLSGSNASYVGGNVGIGTTSPTTKLHVYGLGNVAKFESTGGNDYPIEIKGTNATSSGFIGTGTNSDMLFWVNGGEKVRFSGNGNVGIGTSSPSSLLHVSASSDPDVRVQSTGATSSLRLWSNSGGTSSLKLGHSLGTVMQIARGNGNSFIDYNGAGSGNLQIRNGIGGTTVTAWDSSGNMGVGTTTPSATLDVNGTAKANSFSIGYERVTKNCGAVAVGVECSVSCPGSKKILTGGCASTGAAFDYNYPSSDTTWVCRATTSTPSMYATATCANLQ